MVPDAASAVSFFGIRAVIARRYRLRRPDQFRRVRRDGRSYSVDQFALVVAAGRRRRLRIGFVVGKKIGGAVLRNRCKRRLREAVRLVLSHIADGYDLVLHVRSSALADEPFGSIRQTVEEILRRAQLWRDTAPLHDAPAELPAEMD